MAVASMTVAGEIRINTGRRFAAMVLPQCIMGGSQQPRRQIRGPRER
jgi:hypothetical protein